MIPFAARATCAFMIRESARHFRALTLCFGATHVTSSRKLQSDGGVARAMVIDMLDSVARHLKPRLGEVSATSVVLLKVQ